MITMLALLIIASCGHVVSKEIRLTASNVSLSNVKSDIDKYKDSIFIWGGTIVETTPGDEGSIIEVISNPLDSYGEIIDKDISEGRFLAVYKAQPLDPLIYKKHRLVTIAGKLIGKTEKPLKGKNYIYALIEIKELYLWKEDTTIYPATQYYYPPYYINPPWYYPNYPFNPYFPYP